MGYGHQIQKGEPFRYNQRLSLSEAERLMRRDLRRFVSMFREYGRDSLLLGVLAYNVGPYRLLGTSTTPKSKLLKKLDRGDRNIRQEYLSFNRYNGRYHKGLHLRRLVEFDLLYQP